MSALVLKQNNWYDILRRMQEDVDVKHNRVRVIEQIPVPRQDSVIPHYRQTQTRSN